MSMSMKSRGLWGVGDSPNSKVVITRKCVFFLCLVSFLVGMSITNRYFLYFIQEKYFLEFFF